MGVFDPVCDGGVGVLFKLLENGVGSVKKSNRLLLSPTEFGLNPEFVVASFEMFGYPKVLREVEDRCLVVR